MYNFAISWQLKVWPDRNALAGTPSGIRRTAREGLLSGKQADLFSSHGGIHAGQPTDFVTLYLRKFLGFVGITEVDSGGSRRAQPGRRCASRRCCRSGRCETTSTGQTAAILAISSHCMTVLAGARLLLHAINSTTESVFGCISIDSSIAFFCELTRTTGAHPVDPRRSAYASVASPGAKGRSATTIPTDLAIATAATKSHTSPDLSRKLGAS